MKKNLMNLSYAIVNFPEEKAKEITERLIDIDPFNKFFIKGVSLLKLHFNGRDREGKNYGSIPPREIKKYSTWFNAAAVAAVNCQSNVRSSRVIVFSANRFTFCDKWGNMMFPPLYGASVPHYGFAFAYPTTPENYQKGVLDFNYAFELMAHELGGTLIDSPGMWEVCKDRQCFAFGEGKPIPNSDEYAPPKGRSHFCRKHIEYMLEFYKHNSEMISLLSRKKQD